MRVNFLRHSSMNLAVSVGAVICAVAFVGLFEQTARAGEPGSPSGTTTISGKQLPPPDPKFGGVIGRDVRESKSWWPPRVVPPKDAPNVLLILTDDVGFRTRRRSAA